MKFLEILLSFIAGQGKSFLQTNTEVVTQQIVNNARRIATLLAAAIVCIILFCAGFEMAYDAVVTIFEEGTGWEWSPALIGGLLLAAGAGYGLVTALSEKRWMNAVGAKEAREVPAKPQSSAMENAIAVLVLEVADQLKARRENPSPPASKEP